MKSVILSIIMFLFLILIHEFGHFIIAKKSGIKVNEFAIGMGPKIFSKQKGETLYSVNLFPIGGYCAMEGEDDESDDERSFDKAPAYKRFLTILAGPLTNLIFAAILFAIVSFNTGKPSTKIGECIKKFVYWKIRIFSPIWASWCCKRNGKTGKSWSNEFIILFRIYQCEFRIF